MRSVFSDEKKLSIAALSQTLPDRLMLQTMPLSAISRWNCSRWCTEQQEIERLRREVNKLKAERDILKKATAFFAKEAT